MRRTPFFLALGAVTSLALATLAGCSRGPSELNASAEPSTTSRGASAASPPPRPAQRAPAANAAPRVLALHWDDPPRWQKRPPSTPMRAAEYRIPRSGSDAEDGEFFVITFGPGQGGTVDDNIERWVKQMEPLASAIDRAKRTVNGMSATRVEVAGTYTPMAMPAMPSSTTTPRQGQRLIGYVIEAPSGTWFFKMTGPDATVSAASKELDGLIDSLRPS